MPPKFLLDLERVDVERVIFSKNVIRESNPQRYEFEQLDWICHFDPAPDQQVIAGVRDLRADEFWVRGHLPGRPIFPGVLMLEAAAQLGSVYRAQVVGPKPVFGFGGADEVRFRRMLTIGDRLVIVARQESLTSRRSRFHSQGFCAGQLAFEATILGIALPE